MIQKTKDCLPVVITLFNIARRSELKDKTFCQKEKCRSWALGLVTLSSFTKRDRNKTYSSRTSMVIYCETVIFFWIKKGGKLYCVICERVYCTMNVSHLKCIYFFKNSELVKNKKNLTFCFQMQSCVDWLLIFHQVIKYSFTTQKKFFCPEGEEGCNNGLICIFRHHLEVKL